jgi:adenine-specific DNA-methyltransferase
VERDSCDGEKQHLMHYIGSKAKLTEFLFTQITKTVGTDLSEMLFCDLFAGSGAVSKHFKNRVKELICNDLEYYSYVLNYHLIKSKSSYTKQSSLLEKLNGLELKDDGFIFTHYTKNSGRNYFSYENAKKIDTIRSEIERLKECGEVDEDAYFFLLASLLKSADRVANTASLYGAYLKELKKTAQAPMILEALCNEPSTHENTLFNEDANELIKKVSGDILYIDPPYNHRQYGANYHILNTIALGDSFVPKGKTGVREYKSSAYCKKSEVYESFEALICEAKFRYIFVSYNDEGVMHQEEIKDIMSKYGSYSLVTKEHQRFKSYKKYRAKTYEHLHILVKEEI